MKSEKKNNIKNIRYPIDCMKAQCMDMVYNNYELIECGGVVENNEVIEDVNVRTDMRKISLDGFKTFLFVCSYITDNNIRYKEYIKKKYKNIKNVDVGLDKKEKGRILFENINELMDNGTEIKIGVDELLKIMGKSDTRYNRKNIKTKLKDNCSSVISEITSSIYINNKLRIIGNFMCSKVTFTEDNKFAIFHVNDLFIYYILHRYICVQTTHELYNSNNLGIMNLTMYVVSFKYNNRYSNAKNVIKVETVLKKLGKTKEDYKDTTYKIFMNNLKRTFKTALEKVDKTATFKIIDTGCARSIDGIINKGKIEFEIPIFKNGRMKYNKVKLLELEKFNEEDNSSEKDLESPF